MPDRPEDESRKPRPRTYLVTGSASGIGAATLSRLRRTGHTAIGVDRRDADIVADLATPEGRSVLSTAAREITGGVCDAVIAVAGVAVPHPVTVAVNYFGAIATLESMLPLLARSSSPRAVAIGSLGALAEIDAPLLDLLRLDDEPAALARAAALDVHSDALGTSVLYSTSKLALARWVREHAAGSEWAGRGVALNVVSPGVIRTPINSGLLDTQDGRAALMSAAPAPFNGPASTPEAVADLALWLASTQNAYVTGQVVYIDGGAESIMRPELV